MIPKYLYILFFIIIRPKFWRKPLPIQYFLCMYQDVLKHVQPMLPIYKHLRFPISYIID